VRIAALYDIHGNLPALEAVLEEVAAEEPDLVVVGGDVVPGPMPVEVLDRLEALPLPVRYIQGNGEQEVLSCLSGDPLGHLPEGVLPVVRWCAKQLGARDRDIEEWPETLSVEHGPAGSGVLFCHGTPRSATEIVTRATSDDRVAATLEGVRERLVMCGHTHMPFQRRVGSTLLVNAGSVGMPFGDPGAYWALLGERVELRRTGYDLAAAAERVRATAYPQAELFARSNVLEPPDAAGMVDALEAAARRAAFLIPPR